jgi:hypothetical protein
MRDLSDNNNVHDQPRKRAAVGDGISAGSSSPYRDLSASPPPRHSKARPTSDTYELREDTGRPPVGKRQLWIPDQEQTPKASFADPSNLTSIQAQKSRAQSLQQKLRKANQPLPQGVDSPSPINLNLPSDSDDSYDITLQPETRPISQEQLVAEVKGIYAGLVMVEAKCIQVDNKQASLAQEADPEAQPKLNNEQWQALIALHRTLLHEHHDFFLASQHPSASPALRRLASKYAMPARMWRHGSHSFLELLRHRLPASLDHMLAFIYLAYSMMALLYETVPAFEDTWIECLGDLGRYRMAIEDDDIRDREVWTGVTRHWYSKASDRAPTAGRLYHHLAILARPNALQQLFYYAKYLCVVVPFTSARESILTLFEPGLNSDNAQGQYRLPPLDTAFVKAHGLLFTNRDMEKFDPTIEEFLGLLDNQIGRVTRKFMEQGYYIAVANSVAMLGFASKDSVLMQAICHFPKDEEHDPNVLDGTDPAKTTPPFQSLNDLRNILQRLGDPNVLPLIHVPLVFLHELCKNPSAMVPLEKLNTLREIIELYEGQLGYVVQTKEVSDDKHIAVHRLYETCSALLAAMDSLNSRPSARAWRKTHCVPRLPARYCDKDKKMDFAFRDVQVEQCAELDDESKLMNAVRRIFGSGLSDEQSSQVVEALIQAYSELLDYSDLVCQGLAYSCEGLRPGRVAPNSRPHSPTLSVPEASTGAKYDDISPLARSLLMRIVSLLVKYPPIVRGLYCCHQIKRVAAESTPTATSSASVLTSGIQTGLDWFSQERPAVVGTGLLLGTTLWLVSGDRWDDPKLLPNLTAATTGLVFYLSMDDTCWPGQLAIAAVFGVYLNFMCVQKQTTLLKKTWAMTFVGLLGTGMLASLVVAYCNDFEGKYAHPAILAGRVCLPVTVLASAIWYAFVKCPGVAENLENGDYNGSIYAFLSNFVYNMFVAIMEAMLESMERRRERQRRV